MIDALRNTLIARLPRPPKRLVFPQDTPFRAYHGRLVYHANGKMYRVSECESNPKLMLKMLLEYRKERKSK